MLNTRWNKLKIGDRILLENSICKITRIHQLNKGKHSHIQVDLHYENEDGTTDICRVGSYYTELYTPIQPTKKRVHINYSFQVIPQIHTL